MELFPGRFLLLQKEMTMSLHTSQATVVPQARILAMLLLHGHVLTIPLSACGS